MQHGPLETRILNKPIRMFPNLRQDYLPFLFVFVAMVHSALRTHDVRHLLQQDAIVALNGGQAFLLHLKFLQLEVQMDVRLWRLVVNDGPR